MNEITATSVPAVTLGPGVGGESGATPPPSEARPRRGGRRSVGGEVAGELALEAADVAEARTRRREKGRGRAVTGGRRQPAPVDPTDDQVDEELSPEEAEAKRRRETSRAHEIALRRLTVRGRSRWELATDLAQRDVDPEVAGAVIDLLEGVGLVDDASFATSWVESRRGSQRVSSGQIRRQLRQKGVADEHIDAALAENGPDDLATARDLAQARMRSLRGLDRAAQERRLAGYLARRGYGGGLVSQVVREVLADL